MTSLFASRDFEPASDLSRRLGLRFSNLSMLTRALTHRSYVNENPNAVEDNERLEFLGDAVLDFIVGAWVYNRFPEMPEGDLTKMRSALVRNEQLAEFARHLNLGPALRLGRGEFASGGGQRDGLLGSAFEALIGALYLDSGLKAVEEFVKPLLEECANWSSRRSMTQRVNCRNGRRHKSWARRVIKRSQRRALTMPRNSMCKWKLAVRWWGRVMARINTPRNTLPRRMR